MHATFPNYRVWSDYGRKKESNRWKIEERKKYFKTKYICYLYLLFLCVAGYYLIVFRSFWSYMCPVTDCMLSFGCIWWCWRRWQLPYGWSLNCLTAYNKGPDCEQYLPFGYTRELYRFLTWLCRMLTQLSHLCSICVREVQRLGLDILRSGKLLYCLVSKCRMTKDSCKNSVHHL